MRVISGKARGHTLRASKGLNMRPTADRVKESIFNIIRTKLCGSIVIDLFAGSGGLGIGLQVVVWESAAVKRLYPC
jgi:16S rRNA (guanine966-N2)-methyltransferase